MTTERRVTLFHARDSRSFGAVVLPEELGADLTLHVLDLTTGEQRRPALIATAMKREPAAASTSPYGDDDSLLATLTARLVRGPWVLRTRHTAADVPATPAPAVGGTTP